MSRSIFLLVSRRTPHGVRGLKFGDGVGRHDDAGRTPHGVRGLKFQLFADQQLIYRSHPSRGAWIEMLCVQHWRGYPVVFWRVVWYLRGRDRINVVPVVPVVPVRRARRAWPSWPWPWPCRGYARLSCRGRGRRGSRLCGLWTCRRRVVATRRRMLVFPMVLAASHYPDLRNSFVACIVIAIKQTTTERNRDEEVTTTKATAARAVTRSPLVGAAWMIEN